MELASAAVGATPTTKGSSRPVMPQRQLVSTRHPTRRATLQTIAAGLAAGIPAKSDASSAGVSGSQQYCCRVYAVSDVHTDYARNMQWCKDLSATQHRHDALIVAGDVSDDLALLEEALRALAGKFGWVFFTPGNHELWLRQGDVGLEHSLQKLELVLNLCARLGVHTRPLRIGRYLWVVPLLSWHHASFDQEPDMPDMPAMPKLATADYIACRWPPGLSGGDDRVGNQGLADWFDSQNDLEAWQQLLASRAQYDVISFSHFLPSQALLPEKRFLYYPNLPKAVGSLPLGRRVRQLQPDVHIFGHTHFAWDQRIDGIRYIQAPLCSPAERQRRILTVAFEACMEQAQADPDSGSWLPLQIYQCMLSAAELPPSCGGGLGSRRDSNLGSSSSSGGMAGSGIGRSSSLGSLDGAAAESGYADDVIASIDHAMHGLLTDTEAEAPAVADQQPEELPSAPVKARNRIGSRSSSPVDNSGSPGWSPDVASTMQATPALTDVPLPEGAVQLRHGWMPGNLGAHWSRYYETHERDPSCMDLAPWVQRLYEKRLRRRADAAAVTGRSSSTGRNSTSSSSQEVAGPAAAPAAAVPGPATPEAPAAAARAK